MAISGFEGYEKRLELHFHSNDTVLLQLGGGLRKLDFDLIQQVLREVQCTIVSAVGNNYFDSYVLSESSLFVYPSKVIIKTCGTTQLLKSIGPLIRYAYENLRFTISSCRYTRGSFIFPLSQPFPHSSFDEEISYLEEILPENLCFRKKASVMPSNMAAHSWHVFSATDDSNHVTDDEIFTVEVCMTELDGKCAAKFFQVGGDAMSGDVSGKMMTAITGIGEITPGAIICDFGFDPCGYSMNGINGDRYSTIHVTPEEGYSYASFECVGSIYDDKNAVVNTLKKAVQVFRPAILSISFTSSLTGVATSVRLANALDEQGYKCRSITVDEFPEGGNVVFQTFTRRN